MHESREPVRLNKSQSIPAKGEKRPFKEPAICGSGATLFEQRAVEGPERLWRHDGLSDDYRAAVDPLKERALLNSGGHVDCQHGPRRTNRGPCRSRYQDSSRLRLSPSGLNGVIDRRSLARHLERDSSVPRNLVLLEHVITYSHLGRVRALPVEEPCTRPPDRL